MMDLGGGGIDYLTNPYGDRLSFGTNGPVKISKILLFTTRTDYQQPWQRTYSIEATQGTVNKFQDILYNRGNNSKLSPVATASLIPEIVNIQNKPTGAAEIPNGWQTERLRFMIIAETTGMSGTKRVSYIQGFTEFSDVTNSGLIDPNMVFFINSITNTTHTIDQVYNRIIVTPTSTFNVVSDIFGGTRYQRGDIYDLPKLARPKDIIENNMTLEMHHPSDGRIINGSGGMGQNSAATTSRMNNDPLQYFSRLFNAFVDGKNVSTYTNNPIDVLQNAADCNDVMESTLLEQPIIKAIHNVTGEISPTTFTMNVLLSIDPSINPNDIVVVKNDYTPRPEAQHLDQSIFNALTYGSDTADTLNPTAENLKAVTICHSINGMMLECLITRASISMTNMGGENLVIISDVNSFIPDIDLIWWTNKLQSRIANILMPKITDGGLTMIDAHVTTGITSDTSLTISVNNGPVYLYRFPTYADSLYTPTVTNSDNKALLTEGFQTLADASYI